MQVVKTIGYEGTNIDEFLDCLHSSDVEVLVDIRERAQSRKRGFSKTLLKEKLAEREIGYVHLRSLGDPKPGRDAARSGRYLDFVNIFSAHMETEEARLGMAQLKEIVESQKACLLCFERDHTQCHRNIVTSYLVEETNIEVRHIQVE